MKSRLNRIEIRNFKAFREFVLDLDGRHLLVYGPNGSGKSSLYWALYTFLQSARKSTPNVAKYFDSADPQNLLNIHEQGEAAPTPGEIALTLRNTSTKTDTTYRISQTLHGTRQEPAILKGDLASDFITYRFFFGFSHFRNSEKFNLWPLFQKEILPFCVSTGGRVPLDCWNAIRSGDPNPAASRGLGGTYAYDAFKHRVTEFATMLPAIVDPISTEAQRFYDKYFAADDPAKVTLKLGVTTPPAATGVNVQNFEFTVPEVVFGIQIDGKTINRPQAFLNEAKLTQLALSVRFAASLVNLHESDLKLLVLDDLLVSLDMSNRMKVVEILLSDTFANYQKVVLTHELGFFQEVRRVIGSSSSDWAFYRLSDSSTITSVKSELETARDYLERDQIAECGNQLRKHVEQILTTFLEQVKSKKGLDHLIDRENFASLHQKLNQASSELSLSSYKEFANLLQGQFSPDQLNDVVSPNEIDPVKFAALNNKEKGKIIAKLYAARTELQQSIIDLLSDAARKRLTAMKLLREVEKIKDRILNPASHAGATPLYSKEAEDAIKVIEALDAALTAVLPTL
jgi:hypothetical protein